MGAFTQTNAPMAVKTPLGPDVLLLTGFRGQEEISQLFNFRLDLLADKKKDIPFDKLLGQKMTVEIVLPGNKKRFINGICYRLSQGASDTVHTAYHAEIVPQFWLLTRKAQSRIFQSLSVPEILKIVLKGLDVAFEIQGTFHPRDYCVQYRETDFNFASRLMQEEGIYYFFKHTESGHQMVLANTPGSHPPVPGASKLIFEEVVGGNRPEDRIDEWEKSQEVRSGKYTLWDHCFELPHKHLEADKTIVDSVDVGKVTHKLKVANNDKLELYDYPGEYAQRFDGVAPGGGDRAADLEKIFEDNKRTVAIRMQEEALNSVLVNGASTCRNLVSGHKFTLERHGAGDGEYVLESVSHAAHLAMRAGSGPVFSYHNSFTCVPIGLPFRPTRSTTKPVIPGTQTAVVVGPPGEEIFTDKYGRVKVQFHWDREGKNDAGSSCWVRVAQIWAGKRWGASFWPRIGQEVVVSFLEGDPDQPIIVGSVYNADQMPPYLGDGPDQKHKNDNKLCGVKSNSTLGGVGFNEWRFDDTKGKEQVFIHAQRNMDTRVRGSMMTTVGGSAHQTVGGEKDGNKTGDIRIKVFKDLHETIGNDEIRLVERDQHETIKRNVIREVLEGSAHTAIPKGDVVQQSKSLHMAAETDLVLKGKAVYISADQSIQLAVGGNFILIDASGITIFGTLTRINCPGSVALPPPPTPPTPPAGGPTAGANTLKPEEPAAADTAVSGSKSAPS